MTVILIATVTGALFLFFLYVAVVPFVHALVRDPATAPDGPEPFGAGTAWLAIKTVDIDRAMAILSLGDVEASNWETGLAIAEDPGYADRYVFVTPPVDGWTFVVGLALPHPAGRGYTDQCLAMMLALGKAFPDVQYFYACPVLEITAWARFADGKLRRAFAWGDEGVIWNKGALTDAERSLRLKVFAHPEGHDGQRADSIDEDERGYPEARHALDVAGHWGLNPESFARLPGDPALGYVGCMSDAWKVTRVQSRATIAEPVVPSRGPGGLLSPA